MYILHLHGEYTSVEFKLHLQINKYSTLISNSERDGVPAMNLTSSHWKQLNNNKA